MTAHLADRPAGLAPIPGKIHHLPRLDVLVTTCRQAGAAPIVDGARVIADGREWAGLCVLPRALWRRPAPLRLPATARVVAVPLEHRLAPLVDRATRLRLRRRRTVAQYLGNDEAPPA